MIIIKRRHRRRRLIDADSCVLGLSQGSSTLGLSSGSSTICAGGDGDSSGSISSAIRDVVKNARIG